MSNSFAEFDKIFRQITSFMYSHAQHVEKYACAFLKQMGTEKASNFILVDRRTVDPITGDIVMKLSFELRDEHPECQKIMDEPHPGTSFSCF